MPGSQEKRVPKEYLDKFLEEHGFPAPEDEVREQQPVMAVDSSDLRSDLTTLLNKYNREDVSNTPDYILRDFLWDCLKAFEAGVHNRDQWHGVTPRPGQ